MLVAIVTYFKGAHPNSQTQLCFPAAQGVSIHTDNIRVHFSHGPFFLSVQLHTQLYSLTTHYMYMCNYCVRSLVSHLYYPFFGEYYLLFEYMSMSPLYQSSSHQSDSNQHHRNSFEEYHNMLC